MISNHVSSFYLSLQIPNHFDKKCSAVRRQVWSCMIDKSWCMMMMMMFCAVVHCYVSGNERRNSKTALDRQIVQALSVNEQEVFGKSPYKSFTWFLWKMWHLKPFLDKICLWFQSEITHTGGLSLAVQDASWDVSCAVFAQGKIFGTVSQHGQRHFQMTDESPLNGTLSALTDQRPFDMQQSAIKRIPQILKQTVSLEACIHPFYVRRLWEKRMCGIAPLGKCYLPPPMCSLNQA